MSAPPDYYSVLELPSAATQSQIREAYKRAALKHHPDRVPSDSPERNARTRRFQQINDAYYTLSDPVRRRDYDEARRFHGFSSSSTTSSSDTAAGSSSDDAEYEIPRQPPGGFPWSSFFGGGTGTDGTSGGGANAQGEEQESGRANAQFGSVFEEMLREEGMSEGETATPTGKFWSFIGSLSGGAMGFIVANFPGAVAGAVVGNRLGAVRDARGKSVYAVFQELPQADKARLLSNLAAKVFAHAVGS